MGASWDIPALPIPLFCSYDDQILSKALPSELDLFASGSDEQLPLCPSEEKNPKTDSKETCSHPKSDCFRKVSSIKFNDFFHFYPTNSEVASLP